ncbi:hypothetical protein RUM44_007244 [Polyplax serrata]|uniref:Uncharacterized protein n=1 Tax=Polyplax serrata TaxID=468196 RepID=A0ABR1B064_POLSC
MSNRGMNGRQRRQTTKTNREEGEGTHTDHILGRAAFHPVKTNQETLRYKPRHKGMNREMVQVGWTDRKSRHGGVGERERERKESHSEVKRIGREVSDDVLGVGVG